MTVFKDEDSDVFRNGKGYNRVSKIFGGKR